MVLSSIAASRRVIALGMVSYERRRVSIRAWLVCGRALRSCLFLAAEVSRRPDALWKDRWRWLAWRNAPRVFLRGYDPFLRAQIRPPAWKALCLRVYLRAPVRGPLSLAYQGIAAERKSGCSWNTLDKSPPAGEPAGGSLTCSMQGSIDPHGAPQPELIHSVPLTTTGFEVGSSP